MRNNPQTIQKARNYAFLLLKFRPRSQKEIYQRLKKKNFEENVIQEVVSFLKARGFIDDELFAKAWIEWRLKKPLGLRRIRQELNLKGINKEIIENQIGQIKDKYPEKDIVLKIATDRLNRSKGIEPDKAKRRVFSYLLRRGFSPDIVLATVATLCKRRS